MRLKVTNATCFHDESHDHHQAVGHLTGGCGAWFQKAAGIEQLSW